MCLCIIKALGVIPTFVSKLTDCRRHACSGVHMSADVRVASIYNRDRRIERGRINEGQIFRPGVYVYMGKRTEMEW